MMVSVLKSVLFFLRGAFLVGLVFILFNLKMSSQHLPLTVATINVRRVKTLKRARSVLSSLEGVQADVICLQECALPYRSSYKEWESIWQLGPSLWSGSNANRSDGVAVLVKNKGVQVLGSTVVVCGRILFLSLSFNGMAFNLLNVYCSPFKHERWEIMQELPAYLLGRDPIILTGDFNCVLNREGRKGAGDDFKVDKTSFYLQRLLMDFKLSDIYLALNPGKEAYTWRTNDGSRASRIDFLFARGFAGLTASLNPVFFSDHSLLSCSLAVKSGVAVGRGMWKLNCRLLEDPAVVMAFRGMYKDLQSLQVLFDTRAEWWEEAKGRIKGFFITQGKKRKARERRVWKGLQKRLNRYTDLVNMGFDFKEDWENVKREMTILTENKCKDIMFRCKEKEMDEGEKCTRYFFKKILSRRILMKGLKGDDGVVQKDTAGMLRVAESFYTNLFGEKDVEKDRIGEVLNFVEQVVEDKNILEGKIKQNELENSFKSFKNGKAPGSDGLPYEFYGKFWDLVGSDLLTVFREFENFTVLPESFREGVVTLLFKKGEVEDIKNWRPITLLNFDFKLFSKILTLRMKTVLNDVIHLDQTCAVAGRRITDSLVLVRDAICYARDRDIRLAVLNLDFEKAYDRVSHQYMFSVLKKMGFSEGFLARVGLLYTDIRSKILVNGVLSNAVNVSCGVRQGCPLSPLLFVCCIEPLAQVLRRDARITGLGIPGSGGQETRCVLYMDDVTVLCTDRPSIDRTVNRTEWFGRASGARLNKDKCDLKLYGRWTEMELQGMPVTVKKDQVKILGVFFNSDGRGDGNWEGILKKIRIKLQFWRLRQLTLEGKNLILKATILPLLLFIGVVFVPSRSVLARLDRIIFHFLWGTKWERLRRVVLKRRPEKGGKGVLDFYSVLWCHFVALHVSLCLSLSCKASFFVKYFIGFYLRNLKVLKIPLTVPLAFKMTRDYEGIKKFLKKMGLESCDAETLCKHKSMLSFVQGRDPVCHVWGLAVGRSADVWKEVAHPDLLHRHRDLAWQVAHGVLPVQGVLHARRLAPSGACSWPGCGQEETVRHCLWDCEAAKALWKECKPLMQFFLQAGSAVQCQTIMYGADKPKTKKTWRSLWLTLNCIKEVRWIQRNIRARGGRAMPPQAASRIAFGQIKDYMCRDQRRKGLEWAKDTWGHAAWTRIMGDGGPA